MPLITPEHEFIRRSVREFVEAEAKPVANDLDRQNKEIPEHILKQMAELGYFGVIFPAEEGGMGLDYISMAIVTEELSRGWLSVGSVMTRNIITGTLISAHGTPEQKKKFLPPIARGELMTAAAFTEPDSGSDTASFKTRAVKKGDGYLINGAKMWCTFANRAQMLTVMTRTDPDMSKRHKGLSLILFEKQPGDDFMPPTLTGSPIPTIGYHGMRSYALQFEDAYAPAANLIGGQEGRGFYQLMASYEAARIQTAARGVGVAQAALEEALSYAQARVQFGKPIFEFPRVARKIARIVCRTQAARQLSYYAAKMKDSGKRCDLEAGMAKLLATRAAWEAADACVQIHGGNGFAEEYTASRLLVDARVLSIFEGANEIQAHVIARRLLE